MTLEYEDSSWTNGSWEIKWKNSDEIVISGPGGATVEMFGGDFEAALMSLSFAYIAGQKNANESWAKARANARAQEKSQ